MNMKKILVIIPVFNTAIKLLEALGEKLRAFEEAFAESREVRFLFVDDCSNDPETVQWLNSEKKWPWIQVAARHPLNLGSFAATLTGLDHALQASEDEGDLVVRIDADGEHDPEMVAKVCQRFLFQIDLARSIKDAYHLAVIQTVYDKITMPNGKDREAQKLMAELEGMAIFGRDVLKQASPGCFITTAGALQLFNVLDGMRSVAARYKSRYGEIPRWRETAVMMALLEVAHASIDLNVVEKAHMVAPNRTAEKLQSQMVHSSAMIGIIEEELVSQMRAAKINMRGFRAMFCWQPGFWQVQYVEEVARRINRGEVPASPSLSLSSDEVADELVKAINAVGMTYESEAYGDDSYASGVCEALQRAFAEMHIVDYMPDLEKFQQAHA